MANKVKTMYRQDLSGIICSECGQPCGNTCPAFLIGRCHPRVKSDVYFLNGKIHVECGACHAPIAVIAVAKRKEH